ncbi:MULTISPECIES: glycosyltransferase [Acinetobacter]|uniref:Glycosyltransferase n=1 Tax=Acinetobacter johnsonii TaxID=40214 RepID=A0AAJ6LFU8_ACIJO|nr:MULTISPECIES: glycosyltransferase [Acinetobacter]MBV7309644.1 glycosyltransferase [Acinetobacter sp. CWB-G5]WMG18789.1 glycosyltransferase [Acinetobacter johnsonii]
MMEPLISVYIPTYNRLELLKRAVQSVQNQTYKNFEIIIVDDNSSDGTQDFLVGLTKVDSRIRYFFKDKNSGACVSRNIAINLAQGELITGLDDDDYFLPHRLEFFLDYWVNKKREDSIALFTSNIKSEKSNQAKEHSLFSKKYFKKDDLLFANYVGNQIFTETKTLRQVSGFDESFCMWQDLELWYRVGDLGNFEHVDKPTYFFDTSHLYGRISEAKSEKIFKTVEQFSEKNQLNNFKKRMLNNHLYNYKVIHKDRFANFIKEILKLSIIMRNFFK